MRGILLIVFALLFAVPICGQTDDTPPDVEQLIKTERSFETVATSSGMKSAFIQFLTDDSIIFRPGPVKGRQYWKDSTDPTSLLLSRNIIYADTSSNGTLGYTTGNWRLYQKGKSESYARFGQYVTIWEKRNGQFLATIDISITHDKLPAAQTDRVINKKETRDPNIRGYTPADASLSFTRLSMEPGALGGAYKEFAADNVRFLHDGDPPILGKKNVVEATKKYLSISFPDKIVLYQAADMAYTWNPCQFANSREGSEQGNCLHIWKLRDKKWFIVLGIFARISTATPPVLRSKDKVTASH